MHFPVCITSLSSQELPWIEYKDRGDISGRYPVYIHNFTNFEPTEERPNPPRVFLYYYYNEIPQYPEVECKDRGCWVISTRSRSLFRVLRFSPIIWKQRFPRKEVFVWSQVYGFYILFSAKLSGVHIKARGFSGNALLFGGKNIGLN